MIASDLPLPTEVGQVVRAVGYGGNVTLWMSEGLGTVVRFTRAGNPVIEVKAPGYNTTMVTDTLGCFRLWDTANQKWVRA